jgi:hypothetical protein
MFSFAGIRSYAKFRGAIWTARLFVGVTPALALPKSAKSFRRTVTFSDGR